MSSSKKRPQTAAKKEMTRPITAENIRFLKKSPLVVYPFESKLKIRRVDDNPKVLERVIARKSKTSEKQELYTFVSKLMSRRQK